MKKRRHIQQILVRDIALIMLATLCLALLVAWLVLTHEAIRQSDDMMEGHLNDVMSFVRQVRDFIVAAQVGTPYHRQTLCLVPGDALFLYTDGITEAFSDDGQPYGSERLERTLSHAASTVLADDPNEYCREVCEKVKNDVAEFANRTERSNDITMLCVRFEGTS